MASVPRGVGLLGKESLETPNKGKEVIRQGLTLSNVEFPDCTDKGDRFCIRMNARPIHSLCAMSVGESRYNHEQLVKNSNHERAKTNG